MLLWFGYGWKADCRWSISFVIEDVLVGMFDEICVDEGLKDSGFEEDGEGWSEDTNELLFARVLILSIVLVIEVGDVLVDGVCDNLVSSNLNVGLGNRLTDKLVFGDKLNSLVSTDQRWSLSSRLHFRAKCSFKGFGDSNESLHMWQM